MQNPACRKFVRRFAFLSMLCLARIARAQYNEPPVVPQTEVAAPMSDHGLHLGIRMGYGLPMGKAADTPTGDMSTAVVGQVPFIFDIGYRFDPNFYAGGFVHYGVGMESQKAKDGCTANGLSCSLAFIRLGFDVRYTLVPEQSFAPWIGAGMGFEMLQETDSAAGQSVTSDIHGWEFLHLDVGADARITRLFSLGPFLSFSLAEYDSVSYSSGNSMDIPKKALHEWLMFGVRGAFNL